MEKKVTSQLILPILLLIIAYQWLIAFINKVVNKDFFNQLPKQMKDAISSITFQPYATILKNVGIPNSHLFGILVMSGELFVGVIFLLYAIQKLMRKNNRLLAKLGLLATIVGAFMSLNYAIMGGDTLFVDPGNAFQEAISVDWFMFLMEITLVIYFYAVTAKRNEEVKTNKQSA
ncbi:hypothetical protein HPT25_21670 [Bacillus sp. BRMEA1]|uniref:hypothetical protein n=1 Tax=Neobacillus endophyticus TaxID=2738405 RepID=UPI0015638945|nr:hypothetical protein [Neobacillus endophyticus]NRD79948.1 hypothetical protein [Neobacillus endophyticus]